MQVILSRFLLAGLQDDLLPGTALPIQGHPQFSGLHFSTFH
jgi:hypothetical protein